MPFPNFLTALHFFTSHISPPAIPLPGPLPRPRWAQPRLQPSLANLGEVFRRRICACFLFWLAEVSNLLEMTKLTEPTYRAQRGRGGGSPTRDAPRLKTLARQRRGRVGFRGDEAPRQPSSTCRKMARPFCHLIISAHTVCEGDAWNTSDVMMMMVN